jgi:hypothetical protein
MLKQITEFKLIITAFLKVSTKLMFFISNVILMRNILSYINFPRMSDNLNVFPHKWSRNRYFEPSPIILGFDKRPQFFGENFAKGNI